MRLPPKNLTLPLPESNRNAAGGKKGPAEDRLHPLALIKEFTIMKTPKILFLLSFLTFCLTVVPANAQEKIFARYFDIPVGSKAGTEVTGRIHLERNKDVLTRPVPPGYHFEIVDREDGKLFNIATAYDSSKRIMGVLTVADGKSTGTTPESLTLTIALKDGDRLLNKFNINVKVVEKTLMELLNERYTSGTLKIPRLYGRHKPSDKEVAAQIIELKNNGWKFKQLEKCYGSPLDYKGNFNPEDAYLPTGTIEYDWAKVVDKIGGLGYAYATSKVYGPEGEPSKRRELKDVLYHTMLTFMNTVPIEGKDILIDGKPIGHCTGDGFSLLQANKLAGHQIPTHQWQMTDALVVPSLHLMPEILKDIKAGDKTAVALHDAMIRYNQLFMSIIKERRAIDNPGQRWGEIQDTLYSSGAWADANLGHRSRTMLALPLIWNDYNRPLTYVQYWYSDYYQDKPFKGFSFSPGWSPAGIIGDIRYWMTKYDAPAHKYKQSGFQPDGTISHHIGKGTDAAMTAYGFEWLTDCNTGFHYLKDTEFKVPDKACQFELDRLLNVYPHLFYKQRMDFLIAGRNFLSDQRKFVTDTYQGAVKSLLKARSKDTRLKGVDELKKVSWQLRTDTWEHSGTDAYWVNEFLVHRRGENEKPFYVSLKLKSERTVGAEDFAKKVRKSWHMGYGILPLRVTGEEYTDTVLKNYDWHALPGLTEEWRTDPLPLKGGAQASLPGLNKTAGVLADGKAGMGIYHHLPKETYSSATAFKSYHFIEDKIIAQGTGIARIRPGQGQPVATFIDQSALNAPLTYNFGKGTQVITPGESVSLTGEITAPGWLHQGLKGYIILPLGKTKVVVKTGAEINTTDKSTANNRPGYIIAIEHNAGFDDAYRYIEVPNVNAAEMPARMKALLKDLQFATKGKVAHSVYSDTDKTWQYAFFRPETIKVGGMEVSSGDVAQIMLRKHGDQWVLSAGNPMPDGQKHTLSFTTTAPLAEGTYHYTTRGIYPLEGETVTVKKHGSRVQVTVELPDNRDAARYNYQSDLYAATPIIVTIPEK